MEHEIKQLKEKLDNAIIDIRAVNFWGFVEHGQSRTKVWDVVRHELQYKRQGDQEWVAIPIVDREEINVELPNGELDE